jgi:kynurenine formamidase
MELPFNCQFAGKSWTADLRQGTSLAIPLDFDNPQPNCFGTSPARREPWRGHGFVGSTAAGGSCNVDVIQCIPHCNGTHVESIAHILDAAVPIAGVVPTGLLLTQLISVTPEPWADCGEAYSDCSLPGDAVITARQLRPVIQRGVEGVILRTLPNSPGKRTRDWSQLPSTPYLTWDAANLLVQLNVHHLLVDLPSLDRGDDRGQLVAHHEFWQVPPLSRKASRESRSAATISEMLFVPDSLSDGFYLLSLQAAAWLTDAAPCNPIVYPLHSPT